MFVPHRLPLLLLAFLAACGTASEDNVGHNVGIRDQPATNQAGPTRLLPLVIRTAKAAHRFDVEVAQTPAEQTRGLMFRRSLAADSGMLFLYLPPQTATFWMKDTLIPLDMLFIRADGTIAMIAARTEPNSLETISAGTPVVAVLELNGGRAEELGIRQGDRVNWGTCVTSAAPRNDSSPILDFCPGAS